MPASTPARRPRAISGDLGISYNTHFISYGLDVWGGGGDFYGDRSTTFIYGDVFVKVTDSLTFSFGAWADVNNNMPSAIGGNLQEVDVYPGITYADRHVHARRHSIRRGAMPATSRRASTSASAFNDMGLIWEGFGFNPKVVWHNRVSGNGAQTVGSAFVAEHRTELSARRRSFADDPGRHRVLHHR